MNKKMNEKRLWKLISQHQLAVIECEESNSEIRKENEQLLKKEITDLAKRVNFSYSVALYLLKNGFKVSRSGWGWKGTNVYLQVQFPDENSKMTLPYIYMVKRVFADDGSFVTKYFPCPTSDESIFADDWFLVEA
jgi:hypothetical protein